MNNKLKNILSLIQENIFDLNWSVKLMNQKISKIAEEKKVSTIQPLRLDRILNQVRKSLNCYKDGKEICFDDLTVHELKLLCDILDIFREYIYKI